MQEEDAVKIDLRIPSEGMTLNGFRVALVGNDLYRIMEVPVAFAAEEIGYRDVVELKRAADGKYDLHAVIERAGWRRFDCCVSEDMVESSFLHDLLTRVQEAGGDWVRYFGGCVAIALPPGSTWDPLQDLRGYKAPEGCGAPQRPAEAAPRWWHRVAFWRGSRQ